MSSSNRGQILQLRCRAITTDRLLILTSCLGRVPAFRDAQSLLDQVLLNQRTDTSHNPAVIAILHKTSPNSLAAWLRFWPRAQQVTAAMNVSKLVQNLINTSICSKTLL